MAAYPSQNYPSSYQQHPFQQGGPAVQQLPPGWEARYDANQRRYYFINHQTKVTTWTDPRLSAGGHSPAPQRPAVTFQQPAAQPAQRAAVAPQRAAASPQRAAAAPQRQQESIALQNLGTQRNQEPQRTATTGFGEQPRTLTNEQKRVKAKIMNDYDMFESLLEATLDAAEYNEELTIRLLQNMGYNKKGEAAPSSSTTRGEASSSSRAERQETSRPAQKYEDLPSMDFSSMYKTETAEEEPATEESAAEEPAAEEPSPAADDVGSTDIVMTDTEASDTVSRLTTPVAVSRADVHITMDSGLDELISAGGDPDVSAITPSTRSDALQNLISKVNAIQNRAVQATSSSLIADRAEPRGTTHELASGANKNLAKGPNRNLRGAKSALGKGPDLSLRHGARKEMLGTERAHRISHRTSAIGHNPSLCSGQDRALFAGPRTGTTIATAV
eukprot:Seg2942.2 transcript_id=Seg2942.2/GoldUCD/mRNA.D3Y31 product="E3 ubiquitin-protein ligase pub1" protein_id=Seg2942.2/GoldUCD/D3Y31